MQNIRVRKVCTFLCILCLISIIACVGPEEYDDGLLENLPAVINTKDAFTLNLKANKYTFEESYPLELSFVDSVDFLSISLIITGYSGGDTAFIELYAENNVKTFWVDVTGNGIINPLFSAAEIMPQKLKIRSNNFTGIIDLLLVKYTDKEGPLYGVAKNFPVIIDWTDSFKYLLDADDYSFNHTYSLSINLTDITAVLYTNLFITNYHKGSGNITVLDNNDSLLFSRDFTSGLIEFRDDDIVDYQPTTVQISGNDLEAVIDFTMVLQN